MSVSIGMAAVQNASDVRPGMAAHWPLATLRYNSDVMDSHWLARLAPKFKPSDIQPRASTLKFTPRPANARPGQPGKQILTAHWMPPKRGPVKADPKVMRACRSGKGRIWSEAGRDGTYWVFPEFPTFPGEMRVGWYEGAKLRIGDVPFAPDGSMRHPDGSVCGDGCERCRAAADAKREANAVWHGTGANGEATVRIGPRNVYTGAEYAA